MSADAVSTDANIMPSTSFPATSFRILDLDLEIVSVILHTLVAHDQAAAVRVCKLFALIIGEADKERSFLSSASADGLHELMAALQPKLVAPPSLGILFANGHSGTSKAELRKLVRALPPRMHLVGGAAMTVVGVDPTRSVFCSNARGGGSSIALTLGHFPEAEAGSFFVKPGSIESQLTEHGALEPGWKVFVVMAVGGMGHRSVQDVLTQLSDAHPDAVIIGGFATGRWLCRAHAHRLEVITSGVVGMMFRGNVPLTALVCKGEPEGRLRRAQAALVGEQGKTLLGGLMFTCTARDERHDAQAFANVFPRTALAGMPAGGEIGPQAGFQETGRPVEGRGADTGSVGLHGFTAVYGLFAAPARELAPLSLHNPDVDVAFAQSRQSKPAMSTAAAAATAAGDAAARTKAEEDGMVAEDDDEDDGDDDDDEYDDDDDDDEYDEYDDDDEDDDDDYEQMGDEFGEESENDEGDEGDGESAGEAGEAGEACMDVQESEGVASAADAGGVGSSFSFNFESGGEEGNAD